MNIEVCASPALFDYRQLKDNCLVVVIDVLRATTCFSALFDCGAYSIVPVSDLDLLKDLKQKGYLTAAERGGKKVDFADFGNSPTFFLKMNFSQKMIAYSTTNGTNAIIAAAKSGNKVITACFNNLNAASQHIIETKRDIIILCSGWQNALSMEDLLCAGAIISNLQINTSANLIGDTAGVALDLWKQKSNNFPKSVEDAEHYIRLKKLGLMDDLEYCFQLNKSKSVPVWDGEKLVLIVD